MVQRPRVPQTASPLSPSLLVYCPVTPVLSSTLVAEAFPLASVNTSGWVAGCSSARVTRMPITPSLLSLNTTRSPSAVSVVMRSIVREVPSARNTKRVRSLQQRRAVRLVPFALDRQLALACAALRVDDLLMDDRAHLVAAIGRDRVGVVPEVEAVHVAVVEPQPDVVRMIDALALAAARAGSRA